MDLIVRFNPNHEQVQLEQVAAHVFAAQEDATGRVEQFDHGGSNACRRRLVVVAALDAEMVDLQEVKGRQRHIRRSQKRRSRR